MLCLLITLFLQGRRFISCFERISEIANHCERCFLFYQAQDVSKIMVKERD